VTYRHLYLYGNIEISTSVWKLSYKKQTSAVTDQR
jgi:hypothetical protein